MMRKLYASLAVAAGLAVGGCTAPMGAVIAPIMLDQIGPVAGVDNDVQASKVGRSRAEGIVMFATGDASITAAMRNGGITRVHHVDSQSLNVMGIYSRYETVVYGE